MRDKFEAWFDSDSNYDFARVNDGYRNTYVQYAWIGWQAACKESEKEIQELKEYKWMYEGLCK